MAQSAKPIAFPFKNSMALRIANLITSDIEQLEKNVLNTRTSWQQLPRPLKAHYANQLAVQIIARPDLVQKASGLLHEYEANAKRYIDNPNKRGRPLTQFVHDPNAPERLPDQAYTRRDETEAAEDTTQTVESAESPEARAMREALKRAMDEMPGSINSIPIKRFDGQTPQVKMVPKKDSKQELQKAMEGNAEPNVVSMDEGRVREIAQEEIEERAPEIAGAVVSKMVPKLISAALAAVMPTRVEVVLPDASVKNLGVQHKQFPMLLKTVTRFPVWLPGPAGSGKTTAAKNAASALSVPFHHHGAVDNVYQLLGFIDAGGTYHKTSFRSAYQDGGVFLWDEVDASNPAALVAFNAAIENGECVFPDMTIVRHPECYFIAAANTYGTGATHEYVGRTKLDAATLDRFVMLDWFYDEALERAIAGDTPWTTYVQSVRARCKDLGIKHLVTPRASIRGNDLLAIGVEPAKVIDMVVRKGLAEDHWRNIAATTVYRPNA